MDVDTQSTNTTATNTTATNTMATNTMDASRYDADSIQVLEGMEAVRKRPAMYIGDTSETGLHHLVFEVIDNSIDEALAGRCDTIVVSLAEDGSCSVTDNGAGIPVGIHPETGRPTLEVVMTTLHAGGKFERDGEAAYKVSGGLHGVGVSCVNALSEWLEAEIYREGAIWTQRFERGEVASEIKKRGMATRTGTRITFLPDSQLFETTSFDFDYLANRVRQLAFLNRGVRIQLIDEKAEPRRDETFHYAGGIEAFVRYLNEGKTTLHPQVIYLEGTDSDSRAHVEVALQYNDTFKDSFYSFVNNIHTINGGTHVSGFRSSLTRQFNRYAQANVIRSEKDKLPSGEDYREGLCCVLSVKIPEPQFEGQTKGKLGNREVHGIVESIVNTSLGRWVEENPSAVRSVVNKAVHASRVREAMRKARDLARRKGALSSAGLPGKLWDCSSKNIDETEIFIVEGDSAGGSAKAGRDRRFQAILPIKGKILNVEKATLEKLLSHEEIKTIISALGTGFHDDFEPERLRYGKIIIMTDADVDGSHIRTLLLTFFYRHMQALIEAGRVFVAQPPLYRVKRGRSQRYLLDDGQLRSHLQELGLAKVELTCPDGTVLMGDGLGELLTLVIALEEHARYVAKKGCSFSDYVGAAKPDGTLPLYLVAEGGVDVEGSERTFLFDDEELAQFLAGVTERRGVEPGEITFGDDAPAELVPFVRKGEFVLRSEVENSIAAMRLLKVPLGHFLGEVPNGETYRLVGANQTKTISSLNELAECVRELGQKGVDVQRYKGLGEMNPGQLWETTMDPSIRSMIRIRLVDAAHADHMFSVLMGTSVDQRREFIEKHALDVQDLDI